MKKTIIYLFLLLSYSALSASSYKIKDAEYNLEGSRSEFTGITREYALKTKVPLDFKRIFSDEEELMQYIHDVKQQIENTRNFDKVDVDFSVSEPDESDICNVFLIISTHDSMHFIAAPYPKYSSGDSLNLTVKVKDTNFLGSMETMTGEGKFAIELNDDDSVKDYLLGLGLDFETPFQLGAIDAAWNNSLEFSYTFGNSTPEWKIDSGVTLTKNFNKFSVVTSANQIFARNLDYEDEDVNGTNVHYGDGTYFGEKIGLSIPITIQEIDNWGKIYYTPFFSGVYYWDFDGINENNTDLTSPEISFGQTLSTGRVNWIENFRNGLSASVTNSFAYNFQTYTFKPSVEGEILAYKAFKRFAICTDIYGFAVMNGTKSFGSRLRGVRDKQYFNEESGHMLEKACDSAGALVVNLDIPIRICRIYWDQVPVIKKIKFAKYFNLEAQISPFIDFALFHNEASGTAFNPKDGFLCGGIEGIIYPLRIRGIQVRASLGVDLSRKMPKLKSFFNHDWRDNVSAYELSIGLGLHY